jgi:hypothetical protein
MCDIGSVKMGRGRSTGRSEPFWRLFPPKCSALRGTSELPDPGGLPDLSHGLYSGLRNYPDRWTVDSAEMQPSPEPSPDVHSALLLGAVSCRVQLSGQTRGSSRSGSRDRSRL